MCRSSGIDLATIIIIAVIIIFWNNCGGSLFGGCGCGSTSTIGSNGCGCGCN